MFESRNAPTEPSSSGGAYDSRTEAHSESTAARLDKRYRHDFPESVNPDKSPARTDDGYTTSGEQAKASRFVRAGAERTTIDVNYSHPLEKLLAKPWFQRMLGYISRRRKSGQTMIEEIIESAYRLESG